MRSSCVTSISCQTEPQSSRDHTTDEFDPLLLIRAPVLQIIKWSSALVGGLGLTAGAGLAAVGTWMGNLSSGESVTFIGAAAVLLSTVAVASAWLIVSDIRARSMLTRQEFAARADIASGYLQIAGAEHHLAMPRRNHARAPITEQG